jgi:glucose/arabinose dehydrogenase
MSRLDGSVRPYLLAGGALAAALASAVLVFPSAPSEARAGERQRGKFDGADAGRPRVEVALETVAGGYERPVDLQFAPGAPDWLAVVEQPGKATWLNVRTGARAPLLDLEVSDEGWETGLLGLAFDPRFAENGRLFTNSTEDVASEGKDVLRTRVRVWQVTGGAGGAARAVGIVYEVDQPWANHNGGGLAFGPDGMLYVGLGDGGAANDPKGHGQNPRSALGKMLRLDVRDAPKWSAPKDNPFIGRADVLPEIYALGLRNPWRYSFDPQGRLVAADVGQNTWEEVTFVPPGANLGWKVREGAACFSPSSGCATDGLLDPLWTYGRAEGTSITGGHVALGTAVPGLRGRWVFGDYTTGRLWAVELPAKVTERASSVTTLGRFELRPSCFGRDPGGDLWMCDHSGGRVVKLVAP